MKTTSFIYKAVNWHDEGLETFYGDNNNGFIYGIYAYDDPEDFPIDVSWYKSEEIRNKALEEVINYES